MSHGTDKAHVPSDLRADSMESISSTKMTAGCMQPATANRARTIFSPCPIHLLVREEALMLKKVALMLLAMALPIRVLPVPGGPNRSSPLAGALAPYTKHAGLEPVECMWLLSLPAALVPCMALT